MQQQILNEFISLLQNNLQQKQLHNIDDCINLWLDYSKTRTRPDTILYYQKLIKLVNPFLKSNKCFYIEDLTILKMNSIIADIKALNHYKNNTINKVVSTLKQIMQFCYTNDIVKENQLTKFKKLKKDDTETIIIDNQIINKIFNYLSTLNLNNISNLRNIVFIHLLRDTGARLNELRHIETNNINFSNNSILLTYTKTHEHRYVYFTEITKELLFKYIDKVQPEKYLICNEKTKNMLDDCFIYKFTKKIQKECNIKQSISPHKWRHTLATCLLKENIPLENIRKLLGHSSLEITKKYLHINNDSQKETILSALKEIQDKQKDEE